MSFPDHQQRGASCFEVWLHSQGFWLFFSLKGADRGFGIQAAWRVGNIAKQPYWQKTSFCTWKFSPTLQPSHAGFCSFAEWWIIKVEKEKGNTRRGKISWKAGALSKIVALYKQALWCLICIGKTIQGVTLWILVASGESRMSMIKSMCLQLVGVEDVQVA